MTFKMKDGKRYRSSIRPPLIPSFKMLLAAYKR